MYFFNKRGFTLIELLVVIAIIGILASVILNSLNSARDKGSDSKTKAQVANIRNAANVFYDNQDPDSYGNPTASCGAEMFIDPGSGLVQYTDVNNYPTGTVLTCVSDGLAYAAAASLIDGSEWCVDSTGFSGSIQIDDPLTIDGTEVTCDLMGQR